MTQPTLTRAEAQQRSGLLAVESYEIVLDLGGRHVAEPTEEFRSRTTLHYRGSGEGSTHVDLIAERIEELILDGEALDSSSFDGTRFTLPVTEGDHTLQVGAVHRYSRSGEGLHRFVDPADERVYLYTQFEPADARRVFACFDQPDQKATFEFTVIAPESWLVLSNAPAVEPEGVGDGLARWEFAPTMRMSTYITGLVAGEYHRVLDSHTGAGGEIPLSVVCRQSVVDHLDADRILATTRSGFEVFERHFGVPYAFGTYDQVFVPEFNAGAMENAGLVTIRDEYLFRSRVTAAAYEGRDNTILHELAHMWFGNLVTMTWWDDLWLNESFAEWASHFCQSEYLDDPEHPWVTFCNARKTWAYRQDQLPSTHPIAADMVDLEAVEQNFDGITYAKGASALRQLVAYVGKDNFLAGVRQYFADHAFGNTELSDLLGALTAASGRDLSDWSRQWLEVAGVSTLRPEFELDDEGRFTRFAVRQSAPAQFPVLRDHRVAIGLYADRDGVLTRVERVELDVTGELTEVAELVGVSQPDLVLLNDDDLTYAKVRLDPRSLDTLVHRIGDLDSALARAVCWAAAWDMCRDGEMPADQYVELVLRGAGTETDPSAVQRTLGQAWTAIIRYLPVEARPDAIAAFERGLAKLLKNAEAGSDTQLTVVRQLATAARSDAAADLLTAWLSDDQVPAGLAVDTDLRWHLLGALARLGRIDEPEIEAELARDNTIRGREAAAAVRTVRPTAEAKQAAWDTAVNNPQVPNETHRSICLAFQTPGQEDVLRPFIDPYFEVAEGISAGRDGWPERGSARRDNVLDFLFPTEASEQLVARVEHWLATSELSHVVRRSVLESQDDLKRSLFAQAAYLRNRGTARPDEHQPEQPAEPEAPRPTTPGGVPEDEWPTTEQPIVRD